MRPFHYEESVPPSTGAALFLHLHSEKPLTMNAEGLVRIAVLSTINEQKGASRPPQMTALSWDGASAALISVCAYGHVPARLQCPAEERLGFPYRLFTSHINHSGLSLNLSQQHYELSQQHYDLS